MPAASPGLELLSCELLANPDAVADVLVLNVHNTHRHDLYQAKKTSDKTLVSPCRLSLCENSASFPLTTEQFQ
jgi:hypothetical protein